MFINLIFFLVAVAVLVSFHEFGHFIVARWMGVRVLKFSVGFGRTIWRWQKDSNHTEYAIGLVPLGGYVRMLDEREGEVEAAQAHFAFNRKSLSRRSAIVLAGPVANLALAFFLYWVIALIGTQDLAPVVGKVEAESPAATAGFLPSDRLLAVNDRVVEGWSHRRLYLLDQVARGRDLVFDVERSKGGRVQVTIPARVFENTAFEPALLGRVLGLHPALPFWPAGVGAVIENSPADLAGLKSGDRIQAIDGVPVSDWSGLVNTVAKKPGVELVFSVAREGQVLTVPIVPQAIELNDRTIGRIGIQSPARQDFSERFVRLQRGPIAGAVQALETTWLMSSLTLRMLAGMLTGKASHEHISGPVSIARYAGQSAKLGIVQFLAFLGVLSVSLGILNLLPIPILDGGHLLYFVVEAIWGRPIPEQIMQWGQQLGVAIIVLLMALAFYNDILSLVR